MNAVAVGSSADSSRAGGSRTAARAGGARASKGAQESMRAHAEGAACTVAPHSVSTSRPPTMRCLRNGGHWPADIAHDGAAGAFMAPCSFHVRL